jgi:hypothetical protein
VDVEHVGQLLLDGIGVGEHALGSGTAFGAVVVEQDGFLDAGEFGEQFADRCRPVCSASRRIRCATVSGL